MASAVRFRLPSTLSTAESPQQASFEISSANDFLGDWYMIRTSNTFWKDKRNVRMNYNEGGDDRFFYQAMSSGAIKSVEGRNTPVQDAIATFAWQGKGLLRLFGAKWEILALEASPEEGPAWMITFQHKTMFTSPAVNLACRSKDGMSNKDLRLVEDWLAAVQDNTFRKATQDMFEVTQD
jgi:hypothetical protein